MNKDNFPIELKRLRESASISQEEFSELLSNSHRAFFGVNQVMVSQWERAKTLPSFVRRLGIASFFQADYDFSVEENEGRCMIKNCESKAFYDLKNAKFWVK